MSTTEGLSLSVRRPPPLPRAGIRLCIVSYEVLGPTRNGGIGTAYTTLAEKLAAAGHDVTILHARGWGCDRGRIGRWITHFRNRGIKLVPLPVADVPLTGSGLLYRSHVIQQWLSRREQSGDVFDLVHFHEWLGLGYFSLLARRQRRGFRRTSFCVGLHSPTSWIHEANQTPFASSVQETDAIERRCAELADVVWSPSRYLLDWVSDCGWRLPRHVHVHPNPLPFPTTTPSLDPRPIRELVFFGRLEVRKGFLLFCDALDRLHSADIPAGLCVTFLGKPTEMADGFSDAVIKKRAKRWTFPVRLRTRCDHEQGLRYLSEPSRLAVMPSLVENCPLTVIECLALGVPFLASAVGGTPELVAQECHAANLLAPCPDVLAQRLRLALREGVPPARAADDGTWIDRVWDEWHRQFHDAPPSVDDGDDLMDLVRGQARLIDWLEQQLEAYTGGDRRFLRYRLADAVCACVGKLPLLRRVLRWLRRERRTTEG